MGPELLVDYEEWTRFLVEFQKYYAVQAAFWLREEGRESWYLYIPSPDITDENFDRAYGKVIDILEELGNPPSDALRVKVIGADDPLAKAALEFRRRNPTRKVMGIQGGTFGGLSVDWVLVYPLPVSVPAA